MIDFYVMAIKMGIKTLEDIPMFCRGQVEDALADAEKA